MSLTKACRSATVVHARILILASGAPAQFSARWDEWILLTLREQEGVFFLICKELCPWLGSDQQSLFTSGHLRRFLDVTRSSRTYLVAWQTLPSPVGSIIVSLGISRGQESHWISLQPLNVWPETRTQDMRIRKDFDYVLKTTIGVSDSNFQQIWST